MTKLTLYKFRSLADCESFERTREIIETGKFWFSKLWELNDPMEGVYSHGPNALTDEQIAKIFDSKTRYVICSFIRQAAFDNPTMWGYYAGGFRGVAIEVEVDKSKVEPVHYEDNLQSWIDELVGIEDDEWLRRVLTTKLNAWESEHEYRYLRENASSAAIKYGKIVRVHFGQPFCNVGNRQAVLKKAPDLQRYYRRAGRLKSLAESKGIPLNGVRIGAGKVITDTLPRDWPRQCESNS